MMKQLYSDEDFVRLRTVGKRYIFISVAVLVVCFAICIAVCFFANDNNFAWLEATNIAISSIGGCLAIYLLFDKTVPYFARADYVDKLLSSTTQSIVGVVKYTERVSTVAKHVSANELQLTDDDGRTMVLYWDDCLDCPDFDGRRVTFDVVQNRIVAYEVAE